MAVQNLKARLNHFDTEIGRLQDQIHYLVNRVSALEAAPKPRANGHTQGFTMKSILSMIDRNRDREALKYMTALVESWCITHDVKPFYPTDSSFAYYPQEAVDYAVATWKAKHPETGGNQ